MARPPRKKKAKPRGADARARRLFVAGSCGLGALLALAALEPYLWIGALLRELSFHLLLLAWLLALVAALARAWLAVSVLLVMGLLFAWPLLPLYRPTRPTPQAGPLLRVATAHLAGARVSEARLADWLAREQPDALVLTGVATVPDGAAGIGSYAAIDADTADAGETQTRLLIQRALLAPSERTKPHASRQEHGTPSATLRVGRCRAHVFALSLPSLTAYGDGQARQRALAKLVEQARTPRSVWLGYLGSRADAADLRAFEAHQGVRDGRLGHGRVATAPSGLGALGFPLSHVLVHGWISVRRVAVEPPIAQGAHATLRAVLELTEPRCRLSADTVSE